MAKAFQDLVNVYVRLNNRPRLDELKVHREKLLSEIASRSSGTYDQSWLSRQIEEELGIINSGLEQLA